MELTPEQIHEIAEPYGVLDSEHRRIEFARAIEAEVRKQDEALIRKLVEALESVDGAMPFPVARQVLKVARARMSPPAASEQRAYYTTPGGSTRVILVTKDYRHV